MVALPVVPDRRLEVTPAVVEPNQSITVSGQGFTPDESISQIWIGQKTIPSSLIRSDRTVSIAANGTLSATHAGVPELKTVDSSRLQNFRRRSYPGGSISSNGWRLPDSTPSDLARATNRHD